MRRMRRLADKAKDDKIEKSYALERYSSRMASILGPPFVKKKVKRRKRRNERRFQKKKHHQEREPSGNLNWTFILHNQSCLKPL
jgi:hypothetical protein